MNDSDAEEGDNHGKDDYEEEEIEKKKSKYN